MLDLKSSKSSRTSKRKTAARNECGAWFAAAVILCAVGCTAAWFVTSHGYTLYYGDAEAHLNIARRIIDSRTPGPEQIGTVWLPLPHVAMLPLVGRLDLWQAGTAGTVIGVAAFVVAGLMLFGAARTAFDSTAAGLTALLLFALNPNVLYLQATPMTEPLVFAALAGLLFSTVLFAKTRSWWTVIAAGLFACAGALTRYEGWFVLPFVAAYFLISGGKRRWAACGLFCAIAGLGPFAWLAHNAWYYANPLEFYNGPYSAKAIYQRALDGHMARYAGDHEWGKAILYYRTAAEMCAGWGLLLVGALGAIAALVRRSWWPLLFLLLPGVFYVISMYSSGTPIFVPTLWPTGSYYNTRYGLAVLPLVAFAGAALVAIMPARLRAGTAIVVVAAGVLPWLWNREPITWKESVVNSETRRAWTHEAAHFLRANYKTGDGVLASFGDLTGILREAGIPLRESLHEGNGPAWDGAIARPDLFLHEEWGIAISGDAVASAMLRTQRSARPYRCVKIISFKNSPVIEIYRRAASPDIHADTLHQGSRSQERLSADVGH